jgi:uncharacterized protein YaaQ
MKLVIAIVPNSVDASKIKKALVEKNIHSTNIQTQGGLFTKSSTFYIGINEEKLDELISIFEKHSKRRQTTVPKMIVSEFGELETLPSKVEVGGATIFVLPVEVFIKI